MAPRSLHRQGEDQRDRYLVTIVLAGEAVWLEQIVDRIWRLSYRWRALCFVNLRSGSPRVTAELGAENLLK
jgi:hypothetical protein